MNDITETADYINKFVADHIIFDSVSYDQLNKDFVDAYIQSWIDQMSSGHEQFVKERVRCGDYIISDRGYNGLKLYYTTGRKHGKAIFALDALEPEKEALGIGYKSIIVNFGDVDRSLENVNLHKLVSALEDI